MEFVGTVKDNSPSGDVSLDVLTGNQQRKLTAS